jgi:hypothetical protein
MPHDEFTKRQAEDKLDHYCQNRVPPHARHQVRVTWRFWRDSIILYEERNLPWADRWTKMKIARLDFDTGTKRWTLWGYGRNSKPLSYPTLHPRVSVPPNASLDDVITEIDNDPTGVFWG